MILAVDTSTGILSIALSDGKKVLAETCLDPDRRHSEVFIGTLDRLLRKARITLKDLSLISCTTGPGSFTSVRVGMTACRMLSQALKVPLVGISTLDILAENARGMCLRKQISSLVCPLICNQKEEVYTSSYEATKTGKLKRKTPYVSVHIEELLKQLVSRDRSFRIIFTGDGVDVYKELITGRLGSRAVFPGKRLLYPRASVLAGMASGRKGTRYDKVKPMYVKQPNIGK